MKLALVLVRKFLGNAISDECLDWAWAQILVMFIRPLGNQPNKQGPFNGAAVGIRLPHASAISVWFDGSCEENEAAKGGIKGNSSGSLVN